MSALALTHHDTDDYPAPELMPPAAGYAYIHVRDNLNAPSFEIGDVLQVDITVTSFRWDGIYVIQLGDRQIVRRVQHRPDPEGRMAFHIFATSTRDLGFFLTREELVILGAVTTVCAIRRVA